MSSFFESLRRIAQGKPLFDPQQPAGGHDQHADLASLPGEHTNTTMTRSGPKVIPRVVIEHVESHVNGHHMDCRGVIRNESNAQVFLDKVRLLGTSRELDSAMRPGESREFLLYTGSIPQQGNMYACELQYRDATGDYFTGLHNLQFARQSDGTYLPNAARYNGINDI